MKYVEHFQDDHIIINQYISELNSFAKNGDLNLSALEYYLKFFEEFTINNHFLIEGKYLESIAQNKKIDIADLLKERENAISKAKKCYNELSEQYNNRNPKLKVKDLQVHIINLMGSLKECISIEDKLYRIINKSDTSDADGQLEVILQENPKTFNDFF